MFGYVFGCFAWGAVKARALGAHSAGSFGFGGAELLEELQYRFGAERMVAPRLGLAPETARIGTSLLFGLTHPGHELDAALGGYVHSKAYDAHGFKGAILSHLAHNLGVWLVARS